MVATGDTYIKIAAHAVNSIRQVEPHVSICIFTDVESKLIPDVVKTGATVKKIEKSSLKFGDKINSIKLSPYDKTIYLDVDIIAVRPFFKDLIRGLDYFPVLIRDGMDFNVNWEVERYGWALTQPNTGVLAIDQTNNQVRYLAEKWEKIYRDKPAPHDQPAFRAALLENLIPYGSLSHDFNTLPNGLLNYPPRILHLTGDSGNNFLNNASVEEKETLILRYIQPFKDRDCGGLLHLDHTPLLFWSRKKSRWISLTQKLKS